MEEIEFFQEKELFLPEKSKEKRIDSLPYQQWRSRSYLLIDFLFFNSFLEKEENCHVIYITSSSCHLPALLNLFPFLTLHVYNYKRRNKQSSGIKYRKENFSRELAFCWSNTAKILPVYLICKNVERKKQRQWYEIIKPKKSLLQLEIRKEEKEITYLSGEILVSPYENKNLCYLVPSSREKIYKECYLRLNYFHKLRRKKKYQTLFFTTEYDKAYEVSCLETYLREKREKITKERILFLLFSLSELLNKEVKEGKEKYIFLL